MGASVHQHTVIIRPVTGPCANGCRPKQRGYCHDCRAEPPATRNVKTLAEEVRATFKPLTDFQFIRKLGAGYGLHDFRKSLRWHPENAPKPVPCMTPAEHRAELGRFLKAWSVPSGHTKGQGEEEY